MNDKLGLTLLFSMCIILSFAFGQMHGKRAEAVYLSNLYGMDYQAVKMEVKVCKLLADEDTECHLQMKNVEVGKSHYQKVSGRRARFCEGDLPKPFKNKLLEGVD